MSIPDQGAKTPKRAPVALPSGSAPTAPPASGTERPALQPVQILGQSTLYKLQRDDHAFVLAHNIRCWDVVALEGVGDVWLPVVDRIRLLPGAGNIHTVKPGQEGDVEAVFGDEKRRREKLGWVFLESSSLIGSVDVEDPITGQKGIRYLDAWTDIERGAGGDADREVFRREEFNAWRHNLVATGRIHPPTDVVKAKEIRRYKGRIVRNINNPGVPLEIRDPLIKGARERAAQVETAQVPTKVAA